MKIITAGSYYLDIDAYAGIIAYAELLNKQGIAAQAISTATLNESITKTARTWPVDFKTTYTPSDDDMFTLVDVSTPGHFDSFVDEDRIERIIDHHPSHQIYWHDRIGDAADIEFVGAACTQIYEYWQRAGLINQISQSSARLLVCGILDNTLNFGATITTNRDRAAYDDLMAHANLSADWPQQYFSECQESIDNDPETALINDTKMFTFHTYSTPLRVGQLAIWDATALLHDSKNILKQALAKDTDEWFTNVISIGDGKSYFICDNPMIQAWLSELLGVTFDQDIATADRLWLRKEIVQQELTSLQAK